MCHCAIGTGAPFGDSKWAPDPTHPWIAKKQLFNSGFVKLVKRKMAFFQTFKWLIWNKLFRYRTLKMKNFIPRNIAYISYQLNTGWQKRILAAQVCIFCDAKCLISFQQKYFFKMVRYTVIKCYLRPLYFAQKCPQNAGNAVSETQNSKNFQGVMPPDPATLMCCHFTVRVHGPQA